MKNSKQPWTWGTNDDCQLMIYDADGNPVAQVISEDCEADAELICRATNERVKMQAALAGVLNALEDAGFMPFCAGDPLADAVLKARTVVGGAEP